MSKKSSRESDEASSPDVSVMPRRDFLGTSAALVLAAAAACTDGGVGEGESGESGESGEGGEPGPRIDFDPAGIDESLEHFPRTPMAGQMQAESVVIAGHVVGASSVTLRVWQPTENAGEVFSIDEQVLTPDANGFVKARVEGLRGGEWYEYAWFTGDAETGFETRSLLCRVRTALAEGTLEPVRIAIGACIGRGILPEYVDPEDIQPVEVWDTMVQAAEQDYDLFIHLGDQGYMDQVWDAGGSYEQYLAAWGAYHGGGYRTVYPRSGLLFTWDDHEVTNNGTVDPWTSDAEELARIEAAHRAYYTVMPIEGEGPSEAPLWRSFRWGDTVEFIVLDCRSERGPVEDGPYVGEAQYAFLLDRLQNSPCRFKCVVNSVPFARLGIPPGTPLVEQLLKPEDRWEGYADQRDAVQAFVDDNAITNVVWVTGDVHMCYVGQVEGEPSSPGRAMWEVCVTSGNTNPLADQLPEAQFPWRSENAHLPLLTFDPEAGEVHVEFVATDGTVSHARTLSVG